MFGSIGWDEFNCFDDVAPWIATCRMGGGQMSAIDTFKRFRTAMEMTDDQSSFVATCRKKVVSHLNAFFWTNNSDTQNAIDFGSYIRRTGVFGASDIDIAFRLPSEIFVKFDSMKIGRQRAFLELVRSTLVDLDPECEISSRSGSIMLSIEPGQIADVRPYFSVAGRDIYPDIRATEEWSPFVPDLARRVIEAKNAETKGNLVFICRAARAWRTTMNAPISGMLIDTLAYEFISKSVYRMMGPIYHDCLMRDFFRYLATTDPDQDFWYAPDSEETVLRTGPFEETADQAYALAEQAIDNIRLRQDRQAWSKWREVFGRWFASP